MDFTEEKEPLNEYTAYIVPPEVLWPNIKSVLSQFGQAVNCTPAIEICHLGTSNPKDSERIMAVLRRGDPFRVQLTGIKKTARGKVFILAEADVQGLHKLRALLLDYELGADDDFVFGIELGNSDTAAGVVDVVNQEWKTLGFPVTQIVVRSQELSFTMLIGREAEIFDLTKSGISGILFEPQDVDQDFLRLEIQGLWETKTEHDEKMKKEQPRSLIYIVADRSGSMGWHQPEIKSTPTKVIQEGLFTFYEEMKELENTEVVLIPFDNKAECVKLDFNETEPDIWYCPICTLQNQLMSRRCTACNSPQPVEINRLNKYLMPRGGTNFEAAAQCLVDSASCIFSKSRSIRLIAGKGIKKKEFNENFQELGEIGGRPYFVQEGENGYAVWFDSSQRSWLISTKKTISKPFRAFLVVQDTALFPWKIMGGWTKFRKVSHLDKAKGLIIDPEQIKIDIELVSTGKIKAIPVLSLIFISDGKTSASDARAAHLIWKAFVTRYVQETNIIPRVECIGLTKGHSADILDGFIISDSHGSYTNCCSREEIVDSLERGFDQVKSGQGRLFHLKIPSSIEARTNVFLSKGGKVEEQKIAHQDIPVIVKEDNLVKIRCWIPKHKTKELLKVGCLFAEVPFTVTHRSVKDVNSSAEQLEYFKSQLSGMTANLRTLTDHKLLTSTAKKFKLRLPKLEEKIVLASLGPPALSDIKNELVNLLNGKVQNRHQRRAELMKAYRAMCESGGSARLKALGEETITLLSKLKKINHSILVGERLEEIRRHIVDLHYRAKHAKNVERLMMTEAELLKREKRKKTANPPTEEEISNLDDSDGSGCFLQTTSLKETAADGDMLWLVGRVDREGGAQASNTELLNISYVSPFFVCEEYFKLAIDLSPSGFVDGSQQVINARLFPIWGNQAHFNASLPVLDEGLAHTIFLRYDIRLPEFNCLWAVTGHLATKGPHSEKYFDILLNSVLPSLNLFADNMRTYPFTTVNSSGSKSISRAPNLEEDRIKWAQYSRSRLEIYIQDPAARTTSLVSRDRTLIADALLNDFSLPSGFWAAVVFGRLRFCAKLMIPIDFEKNGKEDKTNVRQCLRMIVLGLCDEEHEISDSVDYTSLETTARNELTNNSAVSVGSLKLVNPFNIIFDPSSISVSALSVVAKIASRVNVIELASSHELCKLFSESEKNCSDLSLALSSFKYPKTLLEFLNFIFPDSNIGAQNIRALVGLALATISNNEYLTYVELVPKVFTEPEKVLKVLYDIVRSHLVSDWEKYEAKMKANKSLKWNQELSEKNRSIRGINQRLRKEMIDAGGKVKGQKRMRNVAFLGGVGVGKSTLIGALLVDSGQVSSETLNFMEKESGGQSLRWIMDRDINERVTGRSYQTQAKSVLFTTDLNQYALIDISTQSVRSSASALWPCEYAVIVIPATEDFEKKWHGLRRQCLTLSGFGFKSKFVVGVISKLDLIPEAQRRSRFFEVANATRQQLSKYGMKADKVQFVPVSAIRRSNLCTPATSLFPWYSGPCLSTALDDLHEQKPLENEPTRVFISGRFFVGGVGNVLDAHIISGSLSKGDVLFADGKQLHVASIERFWKEQGEVKLGFCGIRLREKNWLPDKNKYILTGSVDDPLTKRVKSANILIAFFGNTMKENTQFTGFLGGVPSVATVKSLIGRCDSESRRIVESRPPQIKKNEMASVVMSFNPPLAMINVADAKDKLDKKFTKIVFYEGNKFVGSGRVQNLE